MDLIIKKEVADTTLRDVFVIEVTMMHGDADGYTTDKIVIPKEKEEMAKFAILSLEKMLNLPWNGAREAYRKMPNFLIWFSDEFLGDDEDEEWDKRATYEAWEEASNYSFAWHYDRGYDTYTRCDGYEVFFYDANGIKNEVEVKQ